MSLRSSGLRLWLIVTAGEFDRGLAGGNSPAYCAACLVVDYAAVIHATNLRELIAVIASAAKQSTRQ